MSTHRRLTLAVLVAAVAVGACKEKIVNVVGVSTVQVSGAPGTLVIGQSAQLSAAAKDDRSNTLTNRTVSWSSSNSSVASVSTTGLVQAVGAGSANISAQIEGVSGSASLAVNNPVPAISSLSPSTATAATGQQLQITVTGTGFVQTSVVLWNGQDRVTEYVGPTSLRATITAADLTTAGRFNVTVRNPTPGGGLSASSGVDVLNPVPVVTALAPASASAGSGQFELTVTGSGFVTTSVVTWNAQDRATQYVNGTTLKATITAADVGSTGSFNVAVRNPAPGGGTSGNIGISVVNPIPVVNSFTPAFVTVGSAAFQLTVSGTGFVPGSTVLWNGQDRATQYGNATTLTASILAADVATAGSINITVRNPQPGGGTSTAKAYAVNNPVPVITSLSPNNTLYGERVGFILTVTGTGFVKGATVRLKGVDHTTTFVSSTSLTSLLSVGDLSTPGLFDVTVTNPSPGGGTSVPSQFVLRINAPGPIISAQTFTTCAVRGTGETYCWGLNDIGQLGDGTTTDRTVPTRVATTLPFVSVVVGGSFVCGLTGWGAAYCWGAYTLGSSINQSSTPVPVSGNLPFVQISAGVSHACGVTSAGALYCWGDNWHGKLGDGTTTSRELPVAVGAGLTWSRVVAGGYHTCAVTTSGRMYCWGYNWAGQLGDGTTTDRLTPTAVQGGLGFSSVAAAGYNHTCAVTTSGAAYCWGYGGLLGNNAWQNSSTPVAVSTAQVFTSLAIGGSHTCGVTQAGSGWCWGYGYNGQLGNGQFSWANVPVAVNAPALRSIGAGDVHSCAIATTGTAYCWGERAYGNLGDGQSGVRASPTAVSGASSGYTAIAVGDAFSCGLSGSSPRCWGRNEVGQLGDNTSVDRTVPTAVATSYAFSQIATGDYHACGLDASGNAYCWGANWDGELGDGTTNSSLVPVGVTGGLRFSVVSPGGSHTCGVTTAGELRCWGYNYYGQLGDGSTTARNVPTPVSGVSGLTFSKVSAGYYHSCAVTTTGQLYCWGANGGGKLGDGTTTDRPTPVLISVGAPVASVAAGVDHTCAITTTGIAYCWGYGYSGELGSGTSSRLTPYPVSGGFTFRTIATGLQVTCGVTTADAAYCWGRNDWGQLGTGSFSYATSPTAVAGGGAYRDVRAYYYHTCGLTTGGAVRCWGRQRWGELGIGLAGGTATPIPTQGGIAFDQSSCIGDACAFATVAPSPRRSLAPAATAGAYHATPMTRYEPVEPPRVCVPRERECPPPLVRIVR